MPARVSCPSFVGRAEELAALEAALGRAAEGRSAAVLLGGDAGMGKSRLVAEFELLARAQGAEVLVGECVELTDGELPYGPIVAALRPLVADFGEGALDGLHPSTLSALATLWPEFGDVDPAAAGAKFAQGQLFEAVHRLVTARASEHPVALVVEDLHWADRSTRDLLTFLIRNSRHERVLFVASYRTDEVHRRHSLHPIISELERSGRAERVILPPFGVREVHEQLSGILGEEPRPQLVDSLLDRSEGNPFFAEELLAAADEGVMPDSLRDPLLVRVERLSDSARRTLELAAAVGRPVAHDLLASAAQLGHAELNGALREVADQRILIPTDDGARYAFRHSLLRDAVYVDLLPGERAVLHAAIAEALAADAQLAESGRAAAELAHHWYVAGRPGAALVASLDAAALAERVHAYAEAARHLERALELWDRVDPGDVPEGVSRAHVSRRAAEAASLSGTHRRAIAIGTQLVAEADPDSDPIGAGLAHARLARYLWVEGQGDEAIDNYEAALELVPAEPSTERAEVLAASALALMLRGRLAESRKYASEALEIARALGARLVEASVLNTLIPQTPAQFEGAREGMHRARAIAEELGAVEEVGRSYVNEAHVLEEMGRLEESVDVAEAGIARARELGAERGWGYYLAADVADRLLTIGEWDRAADRARDVLDITSNALSAASAHTVLGRIAAERGDFAEAALRVAQSDELSGRAGGAMWTAPNRAVLATCAVWSGDPDEARELVETALEQLADRTVLLFTAPLYAVGVRAEADRAERARALGREADLRAAEAGARSLVESMDTPAWSAAPSQILRERQVAVAELSRLLGEHDPEPWLAVVREWHGASQPYRAAYAEWRVAEALVHSGGSSEEAGALLGSAAETAARLGARPLLAEITGLAKRARLELPGAVPAVNGGASGNDLGLTDREQQVLVLLAKGLTNRQIGETLFMSEKTASVHVSRIVSKLGVANRAAAAGVAHTLGIES
ncbi:MAG TPA: AAA family ATPase [Thermoleophilaceae bacterium]|nr:AAA family ATPase [Thermoleophilaceae bacterium]